MRLNYRLVLASMMVWLAVLLVGMQAQSANLIFSGNWNGMITLGLPAPNPNPYTPYAFHITNPTSPYYSYYYPAIFVSSPPGCFYVTTPVPLWGAGNIATATTTTPTGFFGRNGCDVRGAGLRPATKNNPGNPNPVAGQYGWGYGIANVTTAGSAPRAFTISPGLFKSTFYWVQSPPQTPYFVFSFYVTRNNGAGSFGPGLGLPNTTWSGTGQAFVAKLKHNTGPNQFGGTMRLLGFTGELSVTQTTGGAYAFFNRGTSDLYSCIGGSFAQTCTKPFTVSYKTGTFPSPLNTTATVVNVASGIGFPWGTGTLTLSQRLPIAATGPWLLTTQGYDNRTSGGLGNIKMVTAEFGGTPTGGWTYENELVLKFVPEPGRGVMLAAGALLLAGLVQLRLRRR